MASSRGPDPEYDLPISMISVSCTQISVTTSANTCGNRIEYLHHLDQCDRGTFVHLIADRRQMARLQDQASHKTAP